MASYQINRAGTGENAGKWRKMEADWQEALVDGDKVSFTIKIDYPDGGMRPGHFGGMYWKNGAVDNFKKIDIFN